MSEHQPLPVAGYKPQDQESIDLVNTMKAYEERLLRSLDILRRDETVDQRWLAIGRSRVEEGFMAINRSIFNPSRVKLLDD